MEDLIKKLTSQLDLDEKQARCGAGAMLKFSEERLGHSFSKVSDEIPQARQMMQSAPEWKRGFGYSDDFIGAATFIKCEDHSQGRQKMGSVFNQLEIGIEKMDPFIGIVTDYIDRNVSHQASQQMNHLF